MPGIKDEYVRQSIRDTNEVLKKYPDSMKSTLAADLYDKTPFLVNKIYFERIIVFLFIYFYVSVKSLLYIYIYI